MSGEPVDADVVVVGYGAAGAAAALAATGAGASVIVLEKQPHTRHTPSTRMSGGLVMGVTDVAAATEYLDRCAGGMVPRDVSARVGRAGGRIDGLAGTAWAFR